MQKKLSSSKYYEATKITGLFVDQLVKSFIEAKKYLYNGKPTVINMQILKT
tara:strand:+ start:3487 stop:3639 length:153 start_codon:yes stop_codon:yes gene_type:complete